MHRYFFYKWRSVLPILVVASLAVCLPGCEDTRRGQDASGPLVDVRLKQISSKAIDQEGITPIPAALSDTLWWEKTFRTVSMTERGKLPFTTKEPFGVFSEEDITALSGEIKPFLADNHTPVVLRIKLSGPSIRHPRTEVDIFCNQDGLNMRFAKLREPFDHWADEDDASVRNAHLLPGEGQRLHERHGLFGVREDARWLIVNIDKKPPVEVPVPVSSEDPPVAEVDAPSQGLDLQRKYDVLDDALAKSLITQEEYEAKKSGLDKKREAGETLQQLHQEGLLSEEEYRVKLEALKAGD